MPSNTQLDPSDFAGPSDTLWDHARREYLSGMTAARICQRYGMSLSTFRLTRASDLLCGDRPARV